MNISKHTISYKVISILILLSIGFYSSVINAQSLAIDWQLCQGGSYDDWAMEIEPIDYGGFLTIGFSYSTDLDITFNNGLSDYWVTKIDSNGMREWERNYGGSSYEDYFTTQYNDILTLTADGGFIFAGTSVSNDGDINNPKGGFDFWVVKCNMEGEIIWAKNFGGTKDEIASKIENTEDGGYIVVGSTNSSDGDVINSTIDAINKNFWIVKLSEDGSIEWSKTYGGSNDDVPYSICESGDGSYIVTGYTFSNNGDISSNNGFSDWWLIKIDNIGNLIWEKTFGGSNGFVGYEEVARSIKKVNDGNFIVVGQIESNDYDVVGNHGSTDVLILKMTPEGEIIWSKCYGGSSKDIGYSVNLSFDNTMLIAAESSSNDGDININSGSEYGSNYWLLNIDLDGEIIWEQCFGSTQEPDRAMAIKSCLDSNYIAIGTSFMDGGDVSCHMNAGDYWIIKLNSGLTSIAPNNIMTNQIHVFPNPASNYLIIKLPTVYSSKRDFTIFDLTGNTYAAGSLYPNISNYVNLQIPPGIYYIIIDSDPKTITNFVVNK